MDDSERLKRLSIRVVLLEQRLDEIASLRSGEQRMLSVEGEAVIDWSAVLRAASRRLAGIGATVTASAGVAISHALEGAADDLERQRDAAQGNGEEGRGGGATREAEHVPAFSAAAAADRSAPPPAPFNTIHLVRRSPAAQVQYLSTQLCSAHVEQARLRAQLAEREAELAALKSSERERLIRDVCEAWDGGRLIATALTALDVFERARRAKEKP